MQVTQFKATIETVGTPRQVEFDGSSLTVYPITLAEAKRVILVMEQMGPSDKAPPASTPAAKPQSAAPTPAQEAPPARPAPRLVDEDPPKEAPPTKAAPARSKGQSEGESSARVVPFRGKGSPIAQRAAALEAAQTHIAEPDAGAVEAGEVPPEVVKATSLRVILEWLITRDGTRDPDKLAEACDALRSAIPVLARIKQESLSGRIGRALQIMDLPADGE